MNIRPFCAALVLGATLLVTPAAIAQGRFQFDTTPGYLSKQVLPRRYGLTLQLDPDQRRFTGQVRINLRVRQVQAGLELHAFELNAEHAELVTAGVRRALAVTPVLASQSWRLVPVDGLPIAPGAHQLEIAYAGRVNVAGEGLFMAPYERPEAGQGRPPSGLQARWPSPGARPLPGPYVRARAPTGIKESGGATLPREQGGQAQRMLATQLEAIHARRLFPAFDEPAFRAVFEITVRAPKGYDVLSNMPSKARLRDARTTEHRFAPTLPMPSYLVSVAVGHFDLLRGRAAGVPLQIFTAQGKREFARFALRTTRQVLPYYSQYFGVPYALPKLDQLAVPSVRGGAMEDWGLISYAEDDFLVDPQRSSPATVRAAYATIAHEIAHQWFGNLVTAASWEEIWLNEAFATWLERKATGHFNPGWKIPLQSRRPVERAMAMDAGAATRAIRSGPVRETAVPDVFDPITYAKGGAVLTMLEQWIGPDAFRRGLVAYMKGQRLSNATAADLWHYIGQASGQDVAAVAASWTDQQGFPLVQVRSMCEAGQQRVTLVQSRFRSSASSGDTPSTSAPSMPEPLWKIPVRIARGKQGLTVLLDAAQQSLALGACSDEPVIVNAGGAGFYRVAYDTASQRLMTQRFVDLPEANRVTLLSDTFALVQSGRLPLASYLDVLAALPRVKDSSRTMLWSLARTELDFLDTALAGRPAQQRLRTIASQLLAAQLDQLSWTPAAQEDDQTAELRGTLIAQLAKFGHAPTVAQALRAFDEDDAGARYLPASLRQPVTIAAGMHADRPRFNRLLARLKSAAGEEERWTLAMALAAGRDAQRAEEFLAASLTGVAPANVASAIPGLVARLSPFGDLAYRYTLDHWTPLADLAGSWGRLFLLPGAAAAFNTPEQAGRLVLDQGHSAGANGDAAAAQEADRIHLRAAVSAREAPGLEAGPAR